MGLGAGARGQLLGCQRRAALDIPRFPAAHGGPQLHLVGPCPKLLPHPLSPLASRRRADTTPAPKAQAFVDPRPKPWAMLVSSGYCQLVLVTSLKSVANASCRLPVVSCRYCPSPLSPHRPPRSRATSWRPGPPRGSPPPPPRRPCPGPRLRPTTSGSALSA